MAVEGRSQVNQAPDVGEQAFRDYDFGKFAPIFTSLSRSVVSDQCSASLRKARVRLWLRAEVRTRSPPRPVYPQEQTFERRGPLSHRFRLLHPQEQTFLADPPTSESTLSGIARYRRLDLIRARRDDHW